MKRLGLVLSLAAAIGQGSWGASKERAWQQGMLLNPENNAYFKSVLKTEGTGPSTQPPLAKPTTFTGLSAEAMPVIVRARASHSWRSSHSGVEPLAKPFPKAYVAC